LANLPSDAIMQPIGDMTDMNSDPTLAQRGPQHGIG
jgi:hypothetical protein